MLKQHLLLLYKVKKKIKQYLKTLIFSPHVEFHGKIRFGEKSNIEIFGRSKEIKVGKDCFIDGELKVCPYGGKIDIGNFFYLGENSRIWSGEHIKIGNNVLISHDVNIIDTNSHEIDPSERKETYKKIINEGHPRKKGNIQTERIIIGNDVWISNNTTILKGVTIGDNVIVGSNSLVTADIPPNFLAAGNPLKLIKQIVKK